MDSAGNLYGAAVNGSGTANQGYIYKIDPLGNETTLYNFQGGTTDGCHPQDAPVFDTAGNLYGVTEYCGTDNQGTVWKLSPSGEITILYNFTGGPDGGLPYSGVVLDVFGNLYGVTLQGGDSNGDGVLYEVSTGGTETVLHTFSKATDGAGLFAPVTLGSDGDLYGVSNDGGADGYGTIWGYALVPAGNELAVTLAGTGSGTVTSSPAGINCPGTCTAQFSSGTKVTLTENPASGSKFGGWSGACSGTSSCSVTVKGAVAVTATFTSLKQATTTTLSSSLNPSSYWQSVTFTAKVSAASGTPTGTVTFYGGTTSLGTGTLSGGTATYSTDALPPGSSSITAVYGGDSTNAGSTSSVLSQTVSEANTTTTLTSSQNPSSVGQSVTFTAAVAGQYGGTPTGSVAFYDGTTSLGTEALTSGTAACTTSSLAAGTHSITASYSGDSNYNVSTSAALSQVVKSATTVATKTALKSSENPSLYGASVTFTATVTSTSGTPAGIVTFYDKTTSLGTETLNGSGVATYSTSALVAGKHTIKAVYAGSSQYKTSSKALAQNVQAATTTMLKSSANPSTAGEKVTFTATVTAASGKPTGSVKFYDGTTLLGSGKLNGSGGATYSTSTLASAKHTIKATYAGTTTYKTSSAILTQTVE